MTKLTKTNLFKSTKPRNETPMEKTTRLVRGIRDGETEQRQAKTTRLRKARLEREASVPVEAIKTTPKGTRKKP